MNTIGILGGFLGPYWMGLAKDFTGTYQPGLLTLVIPSLAGAATLVMMRNRSKALQVGEFYRDRTLLDEPAVSFNKPS
jgi:nitrate/nitrite transporter NarK